MTSASEPAGPGGFLQPTLPSSPTSTATFISNTPSTLPHSRSTPLKPGSSKESSFIDYVDRKLLGISRRYEKRYNPDFEDEATSGIEGRGYESFGELAKDLNGVIDVVWMSGTPLLQTPYLLTIALTASTSLPSFPFAPRPTFQLLHKLDSALYSLLQGTNAETGETLPGFEGGRGRLSTTDKVRVRGLVERTRVTVVEVTEKGESVADAGESETEDNLATDDNDNEDDDDNDEIMGGMQVEGNHGRWEMEVARVYERTIVELGMSLGGSVIGGFG